jgi:hypothetical protein
MVTKITSFTAHQTAEGMRLTFTYSVINEDGNLIKSNQRATVIVLAEEINEAIGNINAWLLSKVPQ